MQSTPRSTSPANLPTATLRATQATPSAARVARRLGAAAVASGLCIVVAVGLSMGDGPQGPLAQDVTRFQQQVMPEAGTSRPADAAERLAERYRDALPPATIRRIHDQARAEQRTGATSTGREAFVMRRLEMYEEALGQTRAVAVR